MKRDTLKTVAGLTVIALIVLATFLYGNAQRKAQQKHDQDVKKQQQAVNTTASPKSTPKPTPGATATPKPSPGATATPKPSPKVAPTTGGTGVAANVAPVQTPTSNNLQGNGTAAAAATPTPSAAPTAGTNGMPQTGAPLTGVLGAGAVVVAGLALRRSRKAIVAVARVKAGH